MFPVIGYITYSAGHREESNLGRSWGPSA